MNKLIFIFFLACTISCNPMHDQFIDFISAKPTKEQFKLWHYLFEKPYDLNSEVALHKYKAFKSNLKKFQEINSQNLGYTVGLGPLSDLTWDEIKENYLTLKAEEMPNQELSVGKGINFDELADNDDDHDDVKGRFLQGGDSKDWSYLWDYVKNQSSCGSCWAFGTIGVFEAFLNIKYGIKRRLSEQQLMDCDRINNHGCDGGWYKSAYQHLVTNGIMAEEDYTYRGYVQATCKHNKDKVLVEVNSFTQCTNNGSWNTCTEKDVNNALSKGPYSAAMEVDESLAHYRQGNWLPRYCTKINHAVVVTQVTSNHIKIRNSWGKSWGENGYAKVVKTITATSQMRGCGLLESIFQPNSFSIKTQ